jgi:hypothetical protein
MPAARDDYIMRLITEAAAALRRLRSRQLEGDDAVGVPRDVDAAIAALLGTQQGMLAMLDPWSAANLIGDADRFRLWVELLTVKADALGATPEGARVRARADALRAHVRPAAS